MGVLLMSANNVVFNKLYFFALRERAFFGRPKKVRKKRPFKEDPLGGFLLKDPPPPNGL